MNIVSILYQRSRKMCTSKSKFTLNVKLLQCSWELATVTVQTLVQNHWNAGITLYTFFENNANRLLATVNNQLIKHHYCTNNGPKLLFSTCAHSYYIIAYYIYYFIWTLDLSFQNSQCCISASLVFSKLFFISHLKCGSKHAISELHIQFNCKNAISISNTKFVFVMWKLYKACILICVPCYFDIYAGVFHQFYT